MPFRAGFADFLIEFLSEFLRVLTALKKSIRCEIKTQPPERDTPVSATSPLRAGQEPGGPPGAAQNVARRRGLLAHADFQLIVNQVLNANHRLLRLRHGGYGGAGAPLRRDMHDDKCTNPACANLEGDTD